MLRYPSGERQPCTTQSRPDTPPFEAWLSEHFTLQMVNMSFSQGHSPVRARHEHEKTNKQTKQNNNKKNIWVEILAISLNVYVLAYQINLLQRSLYLDFSIEFSGHVTLKHLLIKIKMLV